ncbi:MAG TPA: alpha/beta hydrolase [Sporichthyaceae bacterium]|nr:alpha/beta hydrolase [Sporichthyaceae bacterium]
MDHRIFTLPGDGLTLTVEAAGPEDGPQVLLVHGGGQTRGSWGSALDALAGRGFCAVALDQRGHGESDWSPDADYEPRDFGADLVALVPALGRRPVVLVGASMGGWASMLATPRLTGVVSGLVLVDVVPRLRLEGTERIVEFMRSAPDGFPDIEAAADAVAAYLPHRPRPALTHGLRRNLRERPDGRLVWHWDPKMVHGRGWDVHARQLEVEAAVRQITVPILLVRGVLSDVVDDEGIVLMRELAPQLQVTDIAGAAHTAAADNNDAFVSTVTDFVTQLHQTAG